MRHATFKRSLLIVMALLSLLILMACAQTSDIPVQPDNEEQKQSVPDENKQAQGGDEQQPPPANICTVIFDTQGGSEVAAQQVEKGDRIVKPQDPEKAGYTFMGWTYSGEDWSFIQHTVTGNMTLMAQWIANTYTVTYILNDGENAQSNPATFTTDSDDITLATPSRTNYIFTGWTWLGQTEPQPVVTIPTGTHEDRTFVANWKIDYVSAVTFQANGVVTGLTDFGKTLSALNIPDVCNGTTLTSIGFRAFDGCTGLTSVTIPNSVTSIGQYAFGDCTSLTSVTVRNGVTSIRRGAFSGCTGLKRITIPDSVTYIGDSAFSGCTGLTSITIPDSVTSIGEYAFRDCTSLTNVTIGNGVTSIGARAFNGCESLMRITDMGTKAKWETYITVSQSHTRDHSCVVYCRNDERINITIYDCIYG